MKKVFLHGFMGCGSDWKVSDGHCPDLPGFGDNLNFPISREALFTQIYNEVIEYFGSSDENWLIGYSLGGRVAMELVYTLNLPVSGCIIYCAHPGLKSDEEKSERALQESKWKEQLLQKDEFLNSWYQNPLFKVLSQDKIFPHLLDKRKQDNGLGWIQSFDYYSLSLQPDLSPAIKESSIPLHYVVGKEDAKFKKIANNLQKECSQVLIYELDGVDHGIPWLVDNNELIRKIVNK